MKACVREDCRPVLSSRNFVLYSVVPTVAMQASEFVSDSRLEAIGTNTSYPYRVCEYMVTINHRRCHTHRLARILAATSTASSVTLGVCSGRSEVRADSTCRVVWRDLHYLLPLSLSVRHPSISLAFPTYIITSTLQFNMDFAVHIAATPPSHYYWPCRSQPFPSHHSRHTSLPANMSCMLRRTCCAQMGSACSGRLSQFDPDSLLGRVLSC